MLAIHRVPGRRVFPSVAATTVTSADSHKIRLRKAYRRAPRISASNHFSRLTRSTRSMLAQGRPLTSHGSFASVMFELVDDDSADDDAAFDDLLPVRGNVGQVEDVIQYADYESADDSTGYGADTTG